MIEPYHAKRCSVFCCGQTAVWVRKFDPEDFRCDRCMVWPNPKVGGWVRIATPATPTASETLDTAMPGR